MRFIFVEGDEVQQVSKEKTFLLKLHTQCIPHFLL